MKEREENATEQSESFIIRKKNKSKKKRQRAKSSEGRALPIEEQKALLERQKRALAEMAEKKKSEAQAEEEKQNNIKKQRNKLKEKILGMIKKDEEYQQAGKLGSPTSVIDKNASQNLKALDRKKISYCNYKYS